MPITTSKFNILNREAGIIAELLTSGLENLRKVSRGHAFYYQSSYSLSTGLERLMKLIIHLENPSANLRTHGHNLENLRQTIGIQLSPTSLEYKILLFMNDFASGERYSIVDYLSDGDSMRLTNEPIIKFYNDILNEVLTAHPPNSIRILPPIDFALVRHTREDLSQINDLGDLLVHGQIIEHASKYCVMYTGRLLQPFIERLRTHDGPPNNPYFSEHFRYLRQIDDYFKNRKTFRS